MNRLDFLKALAAIPVLPYVKKIFDTPVPKDSVIFPELKSNWEQIKDFQVIGGSGTFPVGSYHVVYETSDNSDGPWHNDGIMRNYVRAHYSISKATSRSFTIQAFNVDR